MSRLSMQETQHLLVTEPVWLITLAGCLWVTRRGDPTDYVLKAGQRLALARGDRVAVGAWHAGQSVQWDWTPACQAHRYRGLRRPLTFGLDAAARALRGAAAGLVALARNAASMARRTQGCIRAGDSMASAGTVQ